MAAIQELIDLPALLILVAANSTPVITARILGAKGAAPIDSNRLLRDHRPIFGPHKTWRGLLTGTFAAGIVGALLETGLLLGALIGMLSLAGDLLSSFIKRRLGCGSGRSLVFLDQLPEALLPMLILRGALGLEAGAILVTAVVFTTLDVLTVRFRP